MPLNRSQAPIASPLKALHLPNFELIELNNGIPLYLLPYGKAEVLQLQWIFKAGSNFLAQAGLASYTLRNLQEGTQERTAIEIAQQLDQYGAWIGHDVGNEQVSIQLSTVTQQFSQVLDLFQEVVCQPLFPEAGFEQMKAQSHQNLITAAQKTSFQARRKFGHMLYGPEHPHGKHLGLEELAALQLENLIDFHKECLQPANSVLALCGRFDRDQVINQLNQGIGSLPLGNAPHLTDRSAMEPKNLIDTYYIKRPGPQSTVRTGYLSLGKEHEDYVGMRILVTLLGGFYGSRLMKSIREDKGYTYGVYAALAGRSKVGQLVIQTDVGNQYVKDTVKLIAEAMKRLQNEAPTQSELELVKNYMLGQSVNQRETAFQLGSILRYHIATGISFTEMDDRFEQVKAIEAAKIQELAQKWLKPEAMLSVICGGNS
ncbi:MAG: pitrilysin family protein [Bacteroidota bacterium]